MNLVCIAKCAHPCPGYPLSDLRSVIATSNLWTARRPAWRMWPSWRPSFCKAFTTAVAKMEGEHGLEPPLAALSCLQTGALPVKAP